MQYVVSLALLFVFSFCKPDESSSSSRKREQGKFSLAEEKEASCKNKLFKARQNALNSKLDPKSAKFLLAITDELKAEGCDESNVFKSFIKTRGENVKNLEAECQKKIVAAHKDAVKEKIEEKSSEYVSTIKEELVSEGCDYSDPLTSFVESGGDVDAYESGDESDDSAYLDPNSSYSLSSSQGNLDPDLTYYFDADEDGFGSDDPDHVYDSLPSDFYSTNNEDCDDTESSINPDALEDCKDGEDNDCDGKIDEMEYFTDNDQDTYGTDEESEPTVWKTCLYSPSDDVDEMEDNSVSFNNLDCDDDDDTLHLYKDWYIDKDEDTWGDRLATPVSLCVSSSLEAMTREASDGKEYQYVSNPNDCFDELGSDFDTHIGNDADCDSLISSNDCDDNDDTTQYAQEYDKDCDDRPDFDANSNRRDWCITVDDEGLEDEIDLDKIDLLEDEYTEKMTLHACGTDYDRDGCWAYASDCNDLDYSEDCNDGTEIAGGGSRVSDNGFYTKYLHHFNDDDTCKFPSDAIVDEAFALSYNIDASIEDVSFTWVGKDAIVFSGDYENDDKSGVDYNEDFEFNCSDDEFLVGIDINTDASKPRFEFICKALEGTDGEVVKRRADDESTHCEWFPKEEDTYTYTYKKDQSYTGDHGGYFIEFDDDFTCSSDRFLVGVESTWDLREVFHDKDEDGRNFRYKCCDASYTNTDGKTYRVVQNVCTDFEDPNFVSDTVIVGKRYHKDDTQYKTCTLKAELELKDINYSVELEYSSHVSGFTAAECSTIDTDSDGCYDERSWTECDGNEFLVAEGSEYNDDPKDRIFEHICRALINSSDAQEVNKTNCYWTPYANEWDNKLEFDCGPRYFLAGVRSYHDGTGWSAGGANKEDRRFGYQCCQAQLTDTHGKTFSLVQDWESSDLCKQSGELNDYHEDVSYKAKDEFGSEDGAGEGALMVGVESEHDDGKEDRQFKFKSCIPQPESTYLNEYSFE